jgi:hypothetical protein
MFAGRIILRKVELNASAWGEIVWELGIVVHVPELPWARRVANVSRKIKGKQSDRRTVAGFGLVAKVWCRNSVVFTARPFRPRHWHHLDGLSAYRGVTFGMPA